MNMVCDIKFIVVNVVRMMVQYPNGYRGIPHHFGWRQCYETDGHRVET